jgi:ubiquinone/menaquinone biosynthesis C-methylase UbiE
MEEITDSLTFKKPRLANVQIEQLGPIRIFRDEVSLSESDRKELRFWENDPGEGPDSDIFENVIYKSRFMLTFRRALKFMNVAGGETILELGSGQGWASVMFKRKHPECYVVASDVSPHALLVASKYEAVMATTIDEKWACGASRLPFADNQFDIVFCFAAFHHFIIGDRYRPTLTEIHRVLRPGGRLILLYEPSSPSFFYFLATRRVNQNRAHVAAIDEDVIQLQKLREESDWLNAKFDYQYFPDYQDRLGIASTVYYWVLNKIPFLCAILPCTVNVRITKAAQAGPS